MTFALSFLSNGFLGKNFFKLYDGTFSNTDFILLTVGIILTIISAYLLGSINFAIIISSRSYKQDIRNFGSKNAGMTNMMRTYGKKAAAFTLLGDALKAIVSCLIGYVIIGQPGAYIAGLFCILGHVFPIFYRFKGGKGVVTAAATVLMCDPILFPILLAIFVIIVLFTKYISLGSVMCILLYPFLHYSFGKIAMGANYVSPYVMYAFAMTVIIVCKHWANIKRLLNGTESKFSFKKSVKTANDTQNEEDK